MFVVRLPRVAHLYDALNSIDDGRVLWFVFAERPWEHTGREVGGGEGGRWEEGSSGRPLQAEPSPGGGRCTCQGQN